MSAPVCVYCGCPEEGHNFRHKFTARYEGPQQKIVYAASEPDDDDPETRQRRRDDEYDEWAGKGEWPYGQNF